MINTISIDESLSLENPIFVDVRSENEYSEATILGAINIPIFNNQERAEVGTIYKQVGTHEAKLRGLEIVSVKLSSLVKEFIELTKEGRPLIIFCWRGGMRSESITTILTLMGIKCYKLQSGYKGYRRFVNKFLEQESLPVEIVVLHGLTGVGKTEVLQELKKIDVGVIDLEGIANNRGSVFGWVGLHQQPSQKMFEGSLVQNIILEQKKQFIITECESRRVGKIIIPKLFFDKMQSGKHILLYDSVENRIDRIVRMYTTKTTENKEALIKSLGMLEKRLGKETIEDLTKKIINGDFESVIKPLLIKYYDPLYNYPQGPSENYDLSISTENIQKAAQRIKEYIKTLD